MLTLVFFVGALIFATYRLLRVGRREPDLPPGPPGVPLFGNMLQMPAKELEWQYGDNFLRKLNASRLANN